MTITPKTLDLLPQYRNGAVIRPGAIKGKGGNPHSYLINGEKYARVTTALGILAKPALEGWAKRLTLDKVREVLMDPDVQGELERLATEGNHHELYEGWVDRMIATAKHASDQARDDAADRGTNIHQEIAHVLADPPWCFGEDYPPTVYWALTWLREAGITVARTEMTVWDDTTMVAGTFDGAGWERDGSLVVWDWKTGGGPYFEHALQLGVYARMLEHMTGQVVQSAYIVKLMDDHYSEHRVERLTESAQMYDAARQLHHASKEEWWE